MQRSRGDVPAVAVAFATKTQQGDGAIYNIARGTVRVVAGRACRGGGAAT